MNVPIELAFRGLESSDDIKEIVEQQASRLDRFGDGIMSCRVAVERRSSPVKTGGPYHVRVEVTLPPDGDLVVHKDGSGPDGNGPTSLRGTIRQAFQAMERQVRREQERRRYDVKSHGGEQPGAIVERLFEDDGYGFVRTHEGQQVYFHENSVLHGDFERLTIGTEVRLATEMGDEGLQATSVQVVGKPGDRASHSTHPERVFGE